jgi:hypothetical protein
MGCMLNNSLVLPLLILETGTKERKHLYTILTIHRWTYRIYPTAVHEPFESAKVVNCTNWLSVFDEDSKHLHINPAQYRWKAMSFPPED